MSYPAYRDSLTTSVQFIATIPQHWSLQRMKFSVSKIGSGVTPKGGAENYETEGIPLLRSQNIHFDGLRLDDVVFISDETHQQMDNSQVHPGDVLINITGASIGRCHYFDGTLGEANVNQHVCIIRPESSLSTRFLYYVLWSELGQQQISLEQGGSGREGLNFESLKNFVVPVVSPSEQQQVAAFLDCKTGQIDALMARKKELLEKLKEKRLAVITRAVTQGLNPSAPMRDSGIPWLGQVPQHWEVKRLKFQAGEGKGEGIQIGPFGGMLTELTYAETGEFKLYGQENILSGDFEKGTRWITAEQYAELSQYGTEEGDFLFTRKGSIGGCAIFPKTAHPGIIDSDTIRLRVNRGTLSTRFLLYAFRESEYLQFQVQLIKRGAILSGLNTTTIADLILAAPPLYEQIEIGDYLDLETTRINQLVLKVESAVDRLTEYRTALITAATTGKIDVRKIKVPTQTQP